MDFPLKVDFFPQIRLHTNEKRLYIDLVKSSVQALRQLLRREEKEWKKIQDREGLDVGKVLRIETTNANPNANTTTGCRSGACLVMNASIYVKGTIHEVLEAIGSPITEDYRKAMKFLYKDRFLDGICLHTILPSPQSNESAQNMTTIKWCAFDDGRSMHSAQYPVGTDYCFLEHSGLQMDPITQQMYGFCIQESIVRDREIPSLAGFGLKRGHFRHTGVLILPTDRTDVVQVTSILQMTIDSHTTGASSMALLEKAIQKRVCSIRRIELLLERRRLSKMQFVTRAQWIANEDRKACAVCTKVFNVLARKKHHCRNCGEVVCSTCAPQREVDVSNYGIAHIRICTACVMQVRHQQNHHINNNSTEEQQQPFMYHIAAATAAAAAARGTSSSRSSTANSSTLSITDLMDSSRPYAPVASSSQRHDGHASMTYRHGPGYRQVPLSSDVSSCSSGIGTSRRSGGYSMSSDCRPTYNQSMLHSVAAGGCGAGKSSMDSNGTINSAGSGGTGSDNGWASVSNATGTKSFLLDPSDLEALTRSNTKNSQDNQSVPSLYEALSSSLNDSFCSYGEELDGQEEGESFLRGSGSFSASFCGLSELKQDPLTGRMQYVVPTSNNQWEAEAEHHPQEQQEPPHKRQVEILSRNSVSRRRPSTEPLRPSTRGNSGPTGSLHDVILCLRELKADLDLIDTEDHTVEQQSKYTPSSYSKADFGHFSDISSFYQEDEEEEEVCDDVEEEEPQVHCEETKTRVEKDEDKDQQEDHLDEFDLLAIHQEKNDAEVEDNHLFSSSSLYFSSCSNSSSSSLHDEELHQEDPLVDSPYRDSNSSSSTLFDEDLDLESEMEAQKELDSLRQQVAMLHKSLEDATFQLNYYQTRVKLKTQVENIERDVRQYETNEQQRQSIRQSSALMATRPSTRVAFKDTTSTSKKIVDPVIQKRKQSYHALVSELHEIMGLPALKPRPSLYHMTASTNSTTPAATTVDNQ